MGFFLGKTPKNRPQCNLFENGIVLKGESKNTLNFLGRNKMKKQNEKNIEKDLDVTGLTDDKMAKLNGGFFKMPEINEGKKPRFWIFF